MWNQKGFSLLESVIAMFILTVGILSVSIMQQRAIQSNQSAFSRTSANVVATSFLEALKGMSFDSAALTATAATTEELIVDNTHVFDADNITLFDAIYEVDDSEIIDQENRRYTVQWAVIDNENLSGDVPSKTIRVFVLWTSMMGSHQLIIDTVKYNNEDKI